jgi:hypothetical protein
VLSGGGVSEPSLPGCPVFRPPLGGGLLIDWVVSPADPGLMQPGMGVQFDELSPKDLRDVQDLIGKWEIE